MKNLSLINSLKAMVEFFEEQELALEKDRGGERTITQLYEDEELPACCDIVRRHIQDLMESE